MSDRIADLIARFAGDMRFFAANAVGMALWIVWNTFTPWRFDGYPFQVLTLLLSVEAIFLAIAILNSENRAAEKDRKLAALDYQTNQAAEKEIRLSEQEIRLLMQHTREHGDILRTITEQLQKKPAARRVKSETPT